MSCLLATLYGPSVKELVHVDWSNGQVSVRFLPLEGLMVETYWLISSIDSLVDILWNGIRQSIDGL